MTDQASAAVPQPKVSVVIAAFNAALFIERAVASVQKQSLRDLEIIVVDDLSTDGTCDLVRSLALTEPRLRLVESPRNGGPSAARNRGIAAARGEWIAVLDADDAFKPRRLEMLLAAAEAHDLDMIADDLVYFDLQADREAGTGGANRTKSVLEIDLDRFLQASLFRLPVFDLSPRRVFQYALLKFMIRSDFIQNAGVAYPEHFRDSEDFYFYFKCLLAGARAAILPEASYLYTQRVGSISRKKSAQTRTIVDRGQVVAGVNELLAQDARRMSSRQVRLLKRRRSQALGLQALETALGLVHERRLGPALRLLATSPPSWGFVTRVVVERAQRTAGSSA